MYEVATVPTNPFNIFILRKKSVWYSVNSGNWSDPTIWISNSLNKSAQTVPRPNDTVYINYGHTVTIDHNYTINNCYVSGILSFSHSLSPTLVVNGDLQVSGSVDQSGGSNNLILNGYNNVIPYSSVTAGTASTITYSGSFDQFILNLPYYNLVTQNGKKYQVSDISIAGNFNQQSNYEVGQYNLTIIGNSVIGTSGKPYIFSKNSSIGNILFIGYADFEGLVDLSVGNPNVEFRNGLNIHSVSINTGTGTFYFTTNNQTIGNGPNLSGAWNANITIVGSITITWSGDNTGTVGGVINGTSSSSTFNNVGTLYLGNSTLPMSTGVFNYQYSATSTLGYAINGNYSLPYTSYSNLVIVGISGTKSLSGATIINQSLTIGSITSGGAVFDCSGHDLDVKGIFYNYNTFKASSFCNILFEGAATFGHAVSSLDATDLRIGNPNIEFRAGLTVSVQTLYTGTGTFKFSTADQSFNIEIMNGGSLACNLLISGGTHLTFTGGIPTTSNLTGTIDGDNTSSIFDCQGILNYQNAIAPMVTGKFYCNQTGNTFTYDFAGNQDVQIPLDPFAPGYRNLTLAGLGAKKLLGSISVKGIYTLTAPATLNSNGYSLTNP